jgi:hypothetical protein
MTIPGKLELTIKINEFPSDIKTKGFILESPNIQVFEKKPKEPLPE